MRDNTLNNHLRSNSSDGSRTLFQKNTMILFVSALLMCSSVNSMLVKDWGTDTQIKRLIYSTRELFEASFSFFTAGQNGVYPIADMERNYTQTWHKMTGEVVFLAYNGWIEELSLNMSGLEEHGRLRRLIMTRAERSMALKDHSDAEHQHEMIVCDACILLRAKRVHYAYETVFANYETTGLLNNDEISATISFQMTVASGHNETINQDYCMTELEPILLVPTINKNSSTLNQFNVKMTNIGIFNFLADNINDWMQVHFNSIVLKTIQKKLDVSVRKTLNVKNPCERFLTA